MRAVDDRRYSSPSECLFSEWGDGEVGPTSNRNFLAIAKLLDLLHEEIESLNLRVEELEKGKSP